MNHMDGLDGLDKKGESSVERCGPRTREADRNGVSA